MFVNDIEQQSNEVLAVRQLNATGDSSVCIQAASFAVIGNLVTSDGQRNMTVAPGSCIHQGYKYTISGFGKTFTVSAVEGDTPTTIMSKLMTQLAAVTTWPGASVKPMFVQTSVHIKLLTAASDPAFSVSASGTYTAPAAPPAAPSVYKAHGTVTSLHTKQAYPGVTVSFKTPSGEAYGSPVKTDGSGNWAYDLPSSDYKVKMTAPDPDYNAYENPASLVGNGYTLEMAVPVWQPKGFVVDASTGNRIPNPTFDIYRADGTKSTASPIVGGSDGSWIANLHKHSAYYFLRFITPGYEEKQMLVEDANAAGTIQLNPIAQAVPVTTQNDDELPPAQLGGPAPETQEESKVPVINAIFPPPYQPYISSPVGNFGGGGGGSEEGAGEPASAVKKLKNYFWVVVACALATGLIFHNGKTNIAGGKL